MINFSKFKSLYSVATYFNTEEKCQQALVESRWGDDVVCPHCGQHHCHNAESRENYIYASGLREATTRIIRLVKDDEEQTEWDGTEIAPPIDSDVCG